MYEHTPCTEAQPHELTKSGWLTRAALIDGLYESHSGWTTGYGHYNWAMLRWHEQSSRYVVIGKMHGEHIEDYHEGLNAARKEYNHLAQLIG